MATLSLRGCLISSSLSTPHKAPHFPSSLPLLMQLPFLLLAFLSLLSLAHSHPLYNAEENSIARPFIYERALAASSQASQAQRGSLLPITEPGEEKSLLVDDGAEKLKEGTVSKPSFIYESVAASFDSEAHAQLGSHLHDNVPQDDNTFLLGDGSKHVQSAVKRDGQSIAKPSYIYESVAASLHSRACKGSSSCEVPNIHGDNHLRDNMPQEENSFLLDDGGKYIQSGLEKEIEPIIGKPYIYKSIAASSNFVDLAGSHLRDNAPQEGNSFRLDDGVKHVESGPKREEPVVAKPSFIYESVAALLHSKARKGSLVQDINPAIFLRNGGRDVRKSLSQEASSTQDGGDLLRDNVAQEKYTFLRDDGQNKPISSTQQAGHNGNTKNVQESKPHVEASSLQEGESFLHDNAPQGEHAFLVDDGGKHGSSSTHLKAASILRDNVPQGEYSFLLGDGGKKDLPSGKNEESKNHMKLPIHNKLRPSKGSLRSVVDDSGDSMIKKGNSKMPGAESGNPNEENLRMVVSDSSDNIREKGYQQAPSTEGNPNEESLMMVVTGSLNNITHKENHKAGTEAHPNEDNLKMVVGDSSKNMAQKGQRVGGEEGSPPNEGSLRMVVGDASKHMIQRGRQAAWRGRSQSCLIDPGNVCQQLADEERMNHIALYGQPNPRLWNQPACCGGACVDLSNNNMNCGECGKTCLLLETCCNGKCTDLNLDSSNCGKCGQTCPDFSPCQFGMCGYY